MDKIKYRALSEIAGIRAELQTTISMVNKINQYQRIPINSLKKEVESIRKLMNNTPSLEQWSEYMYSTITPVLLLLEKRMIHLDLNMGIVGVGHNSGIS